MKPLPIILGLVAVMFIIGGIGFGVYFYTQSPTQGTTIPATCNVVTQGTVSSTYTCPSSVDNCEATVTLECNSPTTNARIVLRWSESYSDITDFEPQEVAVDSDGDGDLDRWRRTSETSPIGTVIERFPSPYSEAYIIMGNGDLKVCHPRDSSRDICRVYERGGSISIDNAPVSGYSDLEKIDGNVDIYSCSQDAEFSNPVAKEKVTYSDSSKGGSKKSTFILSKGQTIKWAGIFGSKIDYKENDIQQSECTGNVVDEDTPNKYYLCNIDENQCGYLSTNNPQFCEISSYIYDEQQQKCVPPYNAEIIMSKNVFSTQEEIKGNIAITGTSQINSIPVTVTLIDTIGNPVLGTSYSAITNTQGKLPTDFNLGVQNIIGNYKVRMTINHPLGTNEKFETISITNPLIITLSKGAGDIQYNAKPIIITASTTNSDGESEDIDNFIFTGTVCGDIPINSDFINIQRISRGKYELSTNIEGECIMTWKVSAVDSGFVTEPDVETVTVRNTEILIDASLNDVQDKEVGRHKITFKTLDADLQPISTNNVVQVTYPNGCKSGLYCSNSEETIPAVSVTGTGGNYEFTHNYNLAGLYNVKITSSGGGQVLSTTEELAVNILACSSVSCQGGGGGGGGGGDDPSPINWQMIITIIVLVMAVGFFGWLVFGGKKKR